MNPPLTPISRFKAPPDDLGIEAEASKMSGHGRLLLIYGVAALLVIGAGVLAVRSMTRASANTRVASQLVEIEGRHFRGFFACALPESYPSEMSAQQVRVAFQRLSNNFGKAYEPTLRACRPRLQALTTSLGALQVPAEVEPEHAELVAAGGALVEANAHYLQYLSQGDQEYDHARARPMVDALGGAAAGYLQAQRRLQRALEQ